MPKKKNWSTLIGEGCALVQHVIDRGFEWGFKKAKDVGESEDSKSLEKDYPKLHKAAKVGKGALGFLGEVGNSYYEKYGKLKSKDNK